MRTEQERQWVNKKRQYLRIEGESRKNEKREGILLQTLMLKSGSNARSPRHNLKSHLRPPPLEINHL